MRSNTLRYNFKSRKKVGYKSSRTERERNKNSSNKLSTQAKQVTKK